MVWLLWLAVFLAVAGATATFNSLPSLKELIKMKEDGHVSDTEYERIKKVLINRLESEDTDTSASTVVRRRAADVPAGVGGSSAWLKSPNAKVSFGPQADVNLYRAADGVLKTDSDLHVGGGLKVGADQATCDAAKEGVLRYQDGAFQGCDGVEWFTVLGQTTASPTTSPTEATSGVIHQIFTVTVEAEGTRHGQATTLGSCSAYTNPGGDGRTIAEFTFTPKSATSWLLIDMSPITISEKDNVADDFRPVEGSVEHLVTTKALCCTGT